MEYNQYPEVRDESGKIVWTARPRQLKRGEKVEYELINIQKDALDKTGQKLGIPFIYGIGNEDRVYVSIEKQHRKGEYDGIEGVYVDIAFIEKEHRNGEYTMGNIHFRKENAGAIIIKGGSAVEQAKFEFMEMCNWNASNPNRDTSVKAVFQRVDYKERAQARRKERNLQNEAFNKAKSMGLNELNRMAVAMGYMSEMDEDSIRDKVEDYAFANPERFLNMTENTDTLIQYNAVQAKKEGLISVDMQKRKIFNSNGQTLYTWMPESNVNWTEKFVDFVKSEEGEEFYKSLTTALKPAKK